MDLWVCGGLEWACVGEGYTLLMPQNTADFTLVAWLTCLIRSVTQVVTHLNYISNPMKRTSEARVFAAPTCGGVFEVRS